MERQTSFIKRSLTAVGLVAAVLFNACPSEVTNVLATGQSIVLSCTRSENLTTCACKEVSAANRQVGSSTGTATLSELSNGLTIECPKTTYEFVPKEPTHVCIAKESTSAILQACKATPTKNPIKDLLIQTTQTKVPEWTTTNPGGHSLILPPETFPIVDKSFFAGCLKTSSRRQRNTDVECLVKVDVKARTSAVRDGVLICAYGDKSNTSVPEVTLNAENNSLTIQCGEEGEMQPDPKSLTAYHCTDTNIENCKTVVNLTEVMPSFAKSWWTEDDKNGKAPKLVIPEGGFPAQEETIVLGCNVRSKVSSKGQKEQANTTATLPTCRVKVTLTAQPAASHAPTPSCLGLIAVVFTPFVSFGAY
uniref:SAG5A n=1 Tax=Toxoplasma gondii TaxID=5811 RepID=Q6WAX2_TOXGO|nr:surface antigen 5A [Toxoplasma gondii]AAQ63827.1 SAG5A [Toxoplasma gondii]